ncbi:serine-rich adhesin for platelets isoform X2 [Boleophthalmus pectinirostris]|uniref:serine-rich adhesin for platelets isoform X2 n=1 Tax=Boleophthalmus pectinirostris TaxID=150288 RepID=UPI00242F1768|nr:serine-rich adhesin for platelets isoform X2 [Boleophthalmus pectinirostris]
MFFSYKSKQHQSHHHQETRGDRYLTCGYTGINDSFGQCYEQHYQNSIAHSGPHCEDEFVYDQSCTQVTLSRASSSSLSSSSSSSSSTSWYTETSVTDTFTRHHGERPQHSLSCSNIHDARRFYQLDNTTDPIVFATINHGSNGSMCSEVHRAKGKPIFAPLDRGHSQSDDGFLQQDERKIAKSNLNRSLGFSEEDIMLGVSQGPKRTISSSQLPSKGILKNKEQPTDIRKAKSMEVLSPRVAKEQSVSGHKAKDLDIEQAKEMFVQEKLKFSAFLDEITKQVISPSDLQILGLNANQATNLVTMNETSDVSKPQLPPKKNRDSSIEVNEQIHTSKHVKAAANSSRTYSDSGQSDKFSPYTKMNHIGSPPPQSSHHQSSRKNRRPPSSETLEYGQSTFLQTDGTSTSPELCQTRHRHKPQPAPQNFLSHEQHRASTTGLGSESSSTKSDSSRTRDTVSTATSSEQSGCYHSPHAALSERRSTRCEADHLQALQEENADLQQNLLQTVVCIENLETELQNTRDELVHVKEKYKSLLESHSGTQQANHLLQDHLQAEAETLSNERQHMFTRVAQLTSELEEAHKTIAALENINVPHLIKNLLEKHLFCSAGTKQQLTSTATSFSHLDSSPPKLDGASRDWLPKSAQQQRPTAFSLITHGLTTTENQCCIPGSLTPCPSEFCTADVSAFYNKMPTGLATGSQPVCAQALLGRTTADTPLPTVQQACAGGDNCTAHEGVKVVQAEPAVVTAMSAQQILNDFMQQLWAQKEADRETQQGE